MIQLWKFQNDERHGRDTETKEKARRLQEVSYQ
jgi:hypothetical protein